MKSAIMKKLMKLMPAIAPGLGCTIAFGVMILVIVAPVAAAAEAVSTVADGVGTFFERLGGFFSGNGWNTDEEAFFELLHDENLTCEQSKIVTATIMYYYQTNPVSIEMGELSDPSEAPADDGGLPYGEMLPDLENLIDEIQGGMDNYKDYVINTFLDNEPYNELIGYVTDEQKKKELIYENIISISDAVSCGNSKLGLFNACRGEYSNSGTASIEIKDLNNVYVNVAADSCAQGTLENCNNWKATNVPFKEYIMAVVLAENGHSTNDEALKAQFVASKSYTIGRISSMNRKWHEVDGKYVIYMKGNVEDQVFGDISSMDEIKKNKFSEFYDETLNYFIVDDTNSVVPAAYCADFGICNFCKKGEGKCFAQITANKTLNQTFKQILGYHYSAYKLYDMSNNTIQVSAVDCMGMAVHPLGDVPHRISSYYGYRIHPIYKDRRLHTGIDLGVGMGTPVYAVASGVVTLARTNGGYGECVIIGHDINGDGKYDYYSLYAHNSELLVKAGDVVAGGDQIAKVGSTGTSTGPHLHFEIRDANNIPIDPKPFLDDIKNGTSIFNQISNSSGSSEDDEKINSFDQSQYYIAKNLERYKKYKEKYPNKSISEVIRSVNSNIDYDFYTNITSTDMSDSYLILVNKYNNLSSSYVPNLVTIGSEYGGGQMESTAYKYFKEMVDAAKKDGITLRNVSAYRSYSTQSGLYNQYASRDGKSAADTYSARAGHSEHQTGLATDINTASSSAHFENSSEYKWLINNSYKYGFILRYPQGKEHITGYKFEPWHYRYVGKDAAKVIKERNITFEEYHAYFVKNK